MAPAGSYRLGSQFILRIAGFPIDRTRELGSPALTAAADGVLAAGDAAEAARARAKLAEIYAPEIDRVRRDLRRFAASEPFRRALLFSTPGLEALSPDAEGPLPPRNSDARRREHSWMLYAQRLTAKNDTIGAHGPTAWGRVDPESPRALDLVLSDERIAARAVYVERWVCEGLAARMAADGPVEVVVGAAPFEALRRQVEDWPAGAARSIWLERIDAIEACRAALERDPAVESRRRALTELLAVLERCGVASARASRGLYTARLPVAEGCRRGVERLEVGAPFVEQATQDLAGWYDLWRDIAGLYATRVRDGLEGVWRTLGGAAVPLADFYQACAKSGLHFARNFGTGLAPELYDEVQRAWQEQLGARADAREVALTDDDLAFLRRRFRFERMRAFDNPAPDLQVIARDADAVRRGEWQLLVGEIHPDLALWESCFLIWSPDGGAALAREYREGGHAPAILFGSGVELGVHVVVRAHEWAGDWTGIRPLNATGAASIDASEVRVDLVDGDVVFRAGDGRILGSAVHQWCVAANTHRFELVGTGAHSPRLRVGRAIVQRESWRVEPDDALRAAVDQVGPDALVALRRLKRDRGLPEEVFARPEIRLTYHKDAKPILVDFRSPLSLEVFAGWVRRYLRLRLAEMLPASDECWLTDGEGRYSFELRTVAMPRRDAP